MKLNLFGILFLLTAKFSLAATPAGNLPLNAIQLAAFDKCAKSVADSRINARRTQDSGAESEICTPVARACTGQVSNTAECDRAKSEVSKFLTSHSALGRKK
jgi:hypothetical protein